MRKLIICKVGQDPEFEAGGNYEHVWARTQDIIGDKNLVQHVSLFPGVVLWCDQEAGIRELPFNRQLPMMGTKINMAKVDFVVGAPPVDKGVHVARGNFLLAFEDENVAEDWMRILGLARLCPQCGKPSRYDHEAGCNQGARA